MIRNQHFVQIFYFSNNFFKYFKKSRFFFKSWVTTTQQKNYVRILQNLNRRFFSAWYFGVTKWLYFSWIFMFRILFVLFAFWWSATFSDIIWNVSFWGHGRAKQEIEKYFTEIKLSFQLVKPCVMSSKRTIPKIRECATLLKRKKHKKES